jgi:regulator of protease activity HflC (stomatin/prohibitin superfamily)
MSCGYCCWATISTSEVGVIESFGKFSRLSEPGCTCLACPCEYLSGIISLKVQELNVTFETKTKDNVFVNIQISIQYQAIRDKVNFIIIINELYCFDLTNNHMNIL